MLSDHTQYSTVTKATFPRLLSRCSSSPRLRNIKDAIHFFALLRLTIPYIPESNQLSWQKASGMYHACLNFVSKYAPELIGHGIMRAFDPRGIHFLPGYVPDDINEVMKEYTKKALCLRRSHKFVLSLSGEEKTLSDELDSENLADFVGTKMAYDAFNSLELGHRHQTLAGMNMSAQQLFFFNHCSKWCTDDDSEVPPYAPKRSRCIVPLMNMPEFSSAFGCTAETPMNPREKCTFL
ncbi:neprilysin-1-like isoform X1 [Rhipicephalus microplus]|uniref:neprilysin-1-like isoform X1 n=1 Tax=Rhipicephalus microplus TaxID=6941 RepID=UPI003F6B6A44